MLARPLYATAFTLGTLVFVAAFALGIVQAWQQGGRLPDLAYDELGGARDADALGDYDAAARQLRTYAALQPAKYDGWLRLGGFLGAHGDLAGAIDAYEHATKIIPAPAEAFEQLAVLHFRRGDVARARAYGQIALESGRRLPPDVARGLRLEGSR